MFLLAAPALAQYSANFQTNIISGVTSNWMPDYYVGNANFADALLVQSNGVLTSFGGFIGAGTSSSNSVLVTDSGSSWSNSYLNVGVQGMGNSLVVSNGGQVLDGSALVGGGAVPRISSNIVVVTGTGSIWNNGTDVYVGGYLAGNRVVVNNGGLLINGTSHIGYDAFSSSNNSVVVSDPGSVWTNKGDLNVGEWGQGCGLVISNGGAVFSGLGRVGYNTGASNDSVVVAGSGSLWTNRSDLSIGYSGARCSLAILGSGIVYSTMGYIGNNATAASNSVVVSGTGSVWQANNNLYVGNSGAGNSLVVSNGGRVFSNGGTVGNNYSSNNCVLVTDSGSVWSNSGTLAFGYESPGNSLVISNGGLVISAYGIFRSTSNSVLVSGLGSIWSNRSDLYMGPGSGNSLVISNGGQVVDSSSYVGYGVTTSSNSNSVHVLSSGAWQNNILYVGYGGRGNSVLIGGGSVTATNLIIGTISRICNNIATTILELDSGSVIVTNATGDAVLEVRNGSFILNGGVLQADVLVMTNACGRFVRNGGTMVIGTLVLDPNLDADGDGLPNGWEQQYGLDPLDANGVNGPNGDPDGDGLSNLQEFLGGGNPVANIQSIAREGDDIRVTWAAALGKTNALQATTGDVDGSYSNNFADIFTVTGATDMVTNYLDGGAATNSPSRYYRVRLVP